MIDEKDLSHLPPIPLKKRIREFFDIEGQKTGEITIDVGADGAWIQFDCECRDALPYCKAQCCALIGTTIRPDEEHKGYNAYWDDELNALSIRREADGFCTYLDRPTRLCKIYDDRPETCKAFHCTRGVNVRGWKLSNGVHRHSGR